MCATGGGSNLPAAPPTRYAKSFKRHFEYLERTRGPPSYGAMHKPMENGFRPPIARTARAFAA
ncbi:hypothetical protein BO443_60336 [Burkholderia orbicola]